MAKLIPGISVEEIALKPERDVARELVNQLPDDCLIYHSYPWLKPDRHDRTGKVTLREGEADFVVILPSHGLLILEVKGGEIRYDEQSGQWSRVRPNGQLRGIRDPFEQARRNTHFLKDRITDLGFPGFKSLPFAYGYAVVFPDSDYHGPMPPGAEPAIILSSGDLHYFDRRIPNVLAKWAPKAVPGPMDVKTVDIIRNSIAPSFQLLPVLFRQVADQEDALVRMTNEQVRAFDMLANQKRAAVEGVAGSGKTLLAMAQAERFAKSGNRNTLLVCYNKTLAEWLRSRMRESLQGLVTITHFHGLCSDWCRRAHVEFRPNKGDTEKFWKEEAADLLLSAIDVLPDRFDAVIVDEAQDFYTDWWLPLEHINAQADEGPLYVFYDPAQNLFIKEPGALPELSGPYPLPTNCRNTKKIAGTCEAIIGRVVPTREDAPEGVETQFVTVAGRKEAGEAVNTKLDEWVRKGKLKMSQIAVLSPNRYRNSVVAGIKGATLPFTEDLSDWQDNQAVLFSTIRSFKGLEADGVIMVDVVEPGSSPVFSQVDYYVGCSRAKHVLVVIKEQ